MKQVTLEPIGTVAAIKTQARVLDAILAEKLNVLMACGGRGLCATCHVWVESGGECLTPMTEREKRALARITGATPRSRLACQAKVLKDGATVKLPDGMYIESVADLERLIGQRATTPILHPIDGRVLVERDKIITRSRIMELKSLDVDVAAMRQVAIGI